MIDFKFTNKNDFYVDLFMYFLICATESPENMQFLLKGGRNIGCELRKMRNEKRKTKNEK